MSRLTGEPLSPIARGSFTALISAILFGATAPAVRYFGQGAGAFASAALLYAGAAVGAGIPRARQVGRSIKGHRGRLVAVAIFGAVLAPTCLAWGLQRAGSLTSSLLLNLEAIFTIAFARIIYQEPLGRRVLVASFCMVIGGALLALRQVSGDPGSVLGVVAVMGATIGWALDNTLTRPLSDLEPRIVVFCKGALGALLSVTLAVIWKNSWPPLGSLVALLLCGVVGYGASLHLYLRAQRVLGAARTGSLFAAGPFVGALIAFALGDRGGTLLVAFASCLFALGVWLHATEHHGHRHHHDAMVHDHEHTHNDGHHTHVHDPPFDGSHRHEHAHDASEHDHAHGEDVHHRHGHS